MDAWQAQKYTWGVITGLAIVALLLAVAWWWEVQSDISAVTRGISVAVAPKTGRQFLDIRNRGAMECTFSSADFSGATASRLYIGKKAVRVDHMSSASPTIHAVFTDTDISVWADGASTVDKISLDTPLDGKLVLFYPNTNAKCSYAWGLSDDIFKIPNRI